MLNVLASVSQWEREAISERTTDALRAKRARGECTGGIPYGMQLAADGVHLMPCPAEQVVIARMTELSDCGLSVREIAAKLAREGAASRTGLPFGKSQVQRILKSNPPAMLARAA